MHIAHFSLAPTVQCRSTQSVDRQNTEGVKKKQYATLEEAECHWNFALF